MTRFYGRFVVLMILIIVSLAVTACGDTERVEPLSVTQNQQIIMQLGVKGFKHLNEVKCYGAVVTRVNTGEWSDDYCAGAYGHLYFEAIKHG
jgi:hypothetical protein